MASWLPETLFEIVGQGPAPSKDYYQLLITRTQASESHSFLSLLTPSPPSRATRWGPLQANSHRGLPEAPRLSAPSQRSSLVTSARRPESPFSPQGGLVPGEPSLSPHKCRPLPLLPPGLLPAAFAPRAEDKQASLLACRSPQRGKEGKKDSAKRSEEHTSELQSLS